MSGQVPAGCGRGAQAAAGQEHVEQQQLEEQQPQRPELQRVPCGRGGSRLGPGLLTHPTPCEGQHRCREQPAQKSHLARKRPGLVTMASGW